MKCISLSLKQVKRHVSSIVGKSIGKMWNAYGYVLYVEIGTLHSVEQSTPAGEKYISEQGEWTLCVDGDWKFWANNQIVADSRTEDRATIDPKLEVFSSKKLTIQSFTFNDDGDQAVLTFSNNMQLKIQKDRADEEKHVWSLVQRDTKTWLVVSENGFECPSFFNLVLFSRYMINQEDETTGPDWNKILQQATNKAQPSTDDSIHTEETEPIPSEFDSTLAESYVAVGFIYAMTDSIRERERPEIDMDLIKIEELSFRPEDRKIEVILDQENLKKMPDEHLEWIFSLMITLAMRELGITIEKTQDIPPRLFLDEKNAVL